VRQRLAHSIFDAVGIARRIAKAVTAFACGEIRTDGGQSDIFELHQLKARLREVTGIRLRLVGGDADSGVLEVGQGRLERHLPIETHVRRRIERRAGADQVKLDVRKARRGVSEKRRIEQHRAGCHGVDVAGIWVRAHGREIVGIDAMGHDEGLFRRPLEVAGHLLRQQAVGIHVGVSPVQLVGKRGRRVDRRQGVGPSIDDTCPPAELPRAMDQRNSEAGFDHDVRCGSEFVVNEAVRQ